MIVSSHRTGGLQCPSNNMSEDRRQLEKSRLYGERLFLVWVRFDSGGPERFVVDSRSRDSLPAPAALRIGWRPDLR